MLDGHDARVRGLYDHLWSAHGDEFAILDRSLGPRPPEMLYDVAAAWGVCPQTQVLDLGCGRGNHAEALVRKFGCRVYGIDLAGNPLPIAADPRLSYVNGSAAELPFAPAAFDFVWCRDMLVHVPDLRRVFEECQRVLKPAGRMLVFATFATALMEPAEARRLYAPLAIVPDNVNEEFLAASFFRAGLRAVSVERLGSELIEFYQERDGRASRELMRIARMRRGGFEDARFEAVSAVYHWVIYHLLGKLESVVYLLEK